MARMIPNTMRDDNDSYGEKQVLRYFTHRKELL